MPRTDRYVGKKKGDGHTVLADKKAYLYVPTFRQPYETPFPVIDWDWLDEHLTDDEVFAIKSHPQSHTLTYHDHYNHIVELDRMEASVNYLYDADVVITDYSSIIFDGYLLKKPAVLFEKNPGYVEKRGMYLAYPDDYCTLCATDECELLMDVRLAYVTKKRGLGTIERKCVSTIADACDGHSCERICELIDEMIL
jgi:CDP-glycerol glycerophosphotransferase (TagB/SpsB family)